jgi:hypothetical protein
MKILFSMLAVSALVLAVIAAEKSSKSSILPTVKGRYLSTVTFLLASEQPDVATLVASANTSKSASRLKVRFNGTADPTDTPVPVDLALMLNSKRKVTASSFMLGYYGPTNTAPSKFRKKGNTMLFTLKSSAGASISNTPLEGSVNYRLRVTRKRISISGSGMLRVLPNGTPFPYNVTLAGSRTK